MKDGVIYLPNYVKIEPGNKLNLRKLSYHLYVPAHIDADIRFDKKGNSVRYSFP
jgi:hypothetical protein